MKTKIGTEVAHATRGSDITFKVKRSKVKVTGGWGILWRPSAYRILLLLLNVDCTSSDGKNYFAWTGRDGDEFCVPVQ